MRPQWHFLATLYQYFNTLLKLPSPLELLRDKILVFFLKLERVGLNEHHQINYSELWEYQSKAVKYWEAFTLSIVRVEPTQRCQPVITCETY